jgi:hypothetical protein
LLIRREKTEIWKGNGSVGGYACQSFSISQQWVLPFEMWMPYNLATIQKMVVAHSFKMLVTYIPTTEAHPEPEASCQG